MSRLPNFCVAWVESVCTGALIGATLTAPLSAAAQTAPPPIAPDTAIVTSRETYRLRIHNMRYGRIELSVDGGEHFVLVGRVLRPATSPAGDAARASCRVVRNSAEGVAFTIAPGQVLKVLPSMGTSVPARRKVPECAVITDLEPGTLLLGEFGPPVGTQVQYQSGQAPWQPYPEGLTPTDDTVFAFSVVVPSVHAPADVDPVDKPEEGMLSRLATARKRLTDLAERYAARSVKRAKDAGRSVLSGVISLRAKLPPDEPEPVAAVTYSIDGDIVSAQNTFPSVFAWDTTRLPNGEHVVEIRGLSKYATVITRVRTLVLIMNR